MLNKVTLDKLFKSIIDDNIEDFSSIIKDENCINISFGKYPILSLCYLFNSKKIVNKYENELLQLRSYSKVSDSYNIYKKFIKKAKRCYRIYLGENSIVTPLEMLMILGYNSQLKKAYPVAVKSETIKNNLKAIEMIRSSCDIVATETKIDLIKQPLSRSTKMQMVACITLSIVLILIATISLVTFVNIGIGTQKYPVKINTEQQFITALSTNNSMILEDDITINNISIENYSGTINGNNHTLKINEVSNALIVDFNGSIHDLNVEYISDTYSLSQSNSFFVYNNNGSINNVNFNINAIVNIDSIKDDDVNNKYFSIAVFNNNSNVSNLTIDGNLVINGTLAGNSCFASFIAVNKSEASSLTTLATFNIESTVVDVSGVVIDNQYGANINSSINNASIKQVSNEPGWNPNVGGLVLSNIGTVQDCQNNGAISVEIPDENMQIYTSSSTYLAGVVCINNGLVNKCKNNGLIVVSSTKYTMYVGGVVALTNQIQTQDQSGNAVITSAKISNCASVGSIAIERAENIITFVGCIVGYDLGTVENCYSISSITANAIDDYLFVGGIVGVCSSTIYLSVSNGLSQNIYNNFYLKNEIAKIGIGCVVNGTTLYIGSDLQTGAYFSIDLMKTLEVYW